METKYNPVDDSLVEKYLEKLVDKIFKLLPLREEENPTLTMYHHSLMLELTGFRSLFSELNDKAELISLLSSLESLLTIEDFKLYRSKVFECISLVKKVR
jgi:hypothetical protein